MLLTADAAARIEARLDAALAGPCGSSRWSHAMRYAVQGGKRLRGFLVLESARMLGVPAERAVSAAAAIEALHAYSLVHDDLPCMDDDDLRRGQPTVHVKWDEATAVLAGDALQTLAFELLADPALRVAEVRIALVAALAKASGAEGMVLGQALDIAAETAAAPLTLDEITALQAGKTGALIRWSAEAGALIAEADRGAAAALCHGAGAGLPDRRRHSGCRGRCRQGRQAAAQGCRGAGKATFVSLLGLEGARARARGAGGRGGGGAGALWCGGGEP